MLQQQEQRSEKRLSVEIGEQTSSEHLSPGNYRLNKVVVVSPPLLTNAITRPIKRTHRGSLARTPQNKHEKTCYTARQAGSSAPCLQGGASI